MPKTNIIVAYDQNYGIGKDGTLPWNFKIDLKWFKNRTTSTDYPYQKNAVIMGRNTWKSLPKGALPDRYNIIVSKDIDTPNGAFKANSLPGAINLAKSFKDIGDVYLIGGEQIYIEALSLFTDRKLVLDNIYVTRIDGDYACDRLFPNLDKICGRFSVEKSAVFQDKDLASGQVTNLQIFHYTASNKPDRVMVDGKPHGEYQYLDLLQRLLEKGHRRQTRNAVTYSLFGEKLEFDLGNGFPLITTRKSFLRGIFEELKWFLMGQTDSKLLEEKGVNIWHDNTTREFLDSVGLKHYRDGDIGPMYGYQWLYYSTPYKGCDTDYTGQGFNQFNYILQLLKNDHFSRRIIMTTYNPQQLKEGVLPPCHGICIQFYVEDGHRLSCSMTQRSCDFFLGANFNISSYSLLVHIICELVNNDSKYMGHPLTPGRIVIFLNDVHLYEDHIKQAKEQLSRHPYPFPKLQFKKKISDIKELNWEDIQLANYKYHPAIDAKMVA